MKKVGNLILLAAIVITIYFGFNFVPSRSILGVKAFYDNDTHTLTIGRQVDYTKENDKIIFYIEEQAVEATTHSGNVAIDNSGATIPLEGGVIYKIIISQHIGVYIIMLLIVESILRVKHKSKKKKKEIDINIALN